MNFSSMTGFGRGESQSDLWLVTTEIKSVNHRFKEIRFRLPSLLSAEEIELRKLLDAEFRRGSFEIAVNFRSLDSKKNILSLDYNKVSAFLQEFAGHASSSLSVNPTDFLRSEFLLDADTTKKDQLRSLMIDSLQKALGELKKSRHEEGRKLVYVIRQHLKDFEQNLSLIIKNAGAYEQIVKERLEKKLEQLLSGGMNSADPQRFAQEVIYYLEKLDIAEEQNRIRGHLGKLAQILSTGGEMGRPIDFTLQELNREVNTIGSKSGLALITDAVIQMKVQLEKIREQALNLE